MSSSNPNCWSQTTLPVFREGLATGKVRWSSALAVRGWAQAILDEVARGRPALWPALVESLPQLNRPARLRGSFWLAAGYHPDHADAIQAARLDVWKNIVAPDMQEPAFPNGNMGDMTLLHVLAQQGWSEGLAHLLDIAPDWPIDSLAEGQSALHMAARQGHTACALLLIRHGASTKNKNNEGQTLEQCHWAGLLEKLHVNKIEKDAMHALQEQFILHIDLPPPVAAQRTQERVRI